MSTQQVDPWEGTDRAWAAAHPGANFLLEVALDAEKAYLDAVHLYAVRAADGQLPSIDEVLPLIGKQRALTQAWIDAFNHPDVPRAGYKPLSAIDACSSCDDRGITYLGGVVAQRCDHLP